MGLFSKKRKEGTTLTKSFLGKTEGFGSKGERHFNQRMLKHYLQGHLYFIYKGHVAYVNQELSYI